MSQLTHISQETRTPFCRKCYVPMKKHLVLNLDLPTFGLTEKRPKKKVDDYDYICEKCGARKAIRAGKYEAALSS